MGAPNAPPAFDAVSCSPQTPDEGQTVTCTFSAQDLDSVFYTVGWGDGTPTMRVPSSGTVEPGAPQAASHVYGRGGTFTLSVSATDAGRPPKTGSTTHALPVTEVNTAPTLTTVTCPSAPQRHHVSFACSFLAQDDSNGVRYRVDWGDGTVEEVPAQGFTAPGVATAARHAYAADGTYVVAVSAFDDASPPASSGVRTATVQVQDDQAPPSLSIEDPRMGRWYIGCGQSGSKGIGLALFITKGCVRATAHDPSGVARVEVYRNGALLALDATPPYEIEFNIARFGPAEYDVRAVDVHGYARTLPFSADAIGGSG